MGDIDSIIQHQEQRIATLTAERDALVQALGQAQEEVSTTQVERDTQVNRANNAEAERDAAVARAETAEAGAAAIREGLEWALDEGGWRLYYYSTRRPPPVIVCGVPGVNGAIAPNAGATYQREHARLLAFAGHVRAAMANETDDAALRRTIVDTLTVLDRPVGASSGGTLAVDDAM